VDFSGFNRGKRCRHGNMLYNGNDLHIGRSLDLYGEWAEAELELLGLFIKPGDTVVDAGANVGTHTLFFAGKVGAGGRVFAFEPQRIVFQTLCANLALNSVVNVHAFQAALSRRPGTIVVPAPRYDVPANYGGVNLTGAQGERVPVTTLDDLSIDGCRVLKIDVEGMELDVIEGGRALIASSKPIIYVENNDLSRSPALIERLLQLDYRLFWHVSRFFNPQNYLANPDNVFGDVGDVNMIGVGADLAPAFARFPPVTGPDDDWEALQRRTARPPPPR
jgi:FkbM family methyltransferase